MRQTPDIKSIQNVWMKAQDVNYLITGVRRISPKKGIAYYAVREVANNKVSDTAVLWTKEQVAGAILNGITFTTATWSPIFKKWIAGAAVEVTLRSHADGTPVDNLENLPEV